MKNAEILEYTHNIALFSGGLVGASYSGTPWQYEQTPHPEQHVEVFR
jgi:hypothetical protein